MTTHMHKKPTQNQTKMSKMMSDSHQVLIPGLPDDVALDCLTRLDTSAHPAASDVCRRWRHLLTSREFFLHRQRSGLTRSYACMVQARPGPGAPKPTDHHPYDFGLSIFDPKTRSWGRIDSVPGCSSLPLFCQVAGCDRKLVLMGGWDSVSYDPVGRIFVYDFVTRRWKRGKDMPMKRSFFAMGALNGRVYVAGGHDPDKNGLRSAWAYDPVEDEWTELTQMSETRDECQGLVIGSKFWVVSGYDTNSQGGFKGSAEFYDPDSGTWTRVEDAWVPGRSPKGCVGLGKNGELVNWGELNSDVRVGTCVVELGDRVMVSGSVSHGTSQRVLVGKTLSSGEYGHLEMLSDVPDEFLRCIHFGCRVEV